jgi:hypothetical protein
MYINVFIYIGSLYLNISIILIYADDIIGINMYIYIHVFIIFICIMCLCLYVYISLYIEEVDDFIC